MEESLTCAGYPELPLCLAAWSRGHVHLSIVSTDTRSRSAKSIVELALCSCNRPWISANRSSVHTRTRHGRKRNRRFSASRAGRRSIAAKGLCQRSGRHIGLPLEKLSVRQMVSVMLLKKSGTAIGRKVLQVRLIDSRSLLQVWARCLLGAKYSTI